MRLHVSRRVFAFAVLSCLSGAASADSALDVSPACTNAVQSTGDEVLLGRGAFCQKSEPLEYTIIDEKNAESGRVEIDAYAYSDNPLNRLEWPIKFRFKTRLLSGTGTGLQIKPIVDCGEACTVAPNAGVPLAIGGLSNEVVVMLSPNMRGAKKLEFTPSITYRVAKSGDSLENGESALPFYGKAYIPEIRCDIGLAKATTRGCVYPKAPAIMRSVKTDDPTVDESAVHIREAQAAGMPGKFIARGDGSILPSGSARPLERLRDQAERRKNRKVSKDQCIAQYGKVTGQCTFTGDPDDEPADCDCDEYPFAATRQGASSGGKFSAKRIDSGDNSRSGGRLGCFLTGQRVLDGEEFFVDVEPEGKLNAAIDVCE